MERWFESVFRITGIDKNTVTLFILKRLFITAGTLLLKSAVSAYRRMSESLKLRRSRNKADEIAGTGISTACGVPLKLKENKRDESIDVAKGMLISLMILGHYDGIDGTFRTFVYSFHMLAFVIISGYFLMRNTVMISGHP